MEWTLTKHVFKIASGWYNVGERIPEHDFGPPKMILSRGVKVTYVVKTKFVPSSGILVVTATFSKNGQTSVTKQITITGRTPSPFEKHLAKISSTLISNKDKTTFTTDVGLEEIGEVVTATQLGLAEVTFPDDVTLVYTIKTKYVETSGVIVVTATLSKSGETSVTKAVTITAIDNPFDFTSILERISSYTTSAFKATFITQGVHLNKIGDQVHLDYFGHIKFEDEWLHFLNEFSIEHSLSNVVTPFNSITGKITVKITLKKDSQSVDKNIVITARDA